MDVVVACGVPLIQIRVHLPIARSRASKLLVSLNALRRHLLVLFNIVLLVLLDLC